MTLTPQPGEIRQARRAEPWQDESESPASHTFQFSVLILPQLEIKPGRAPRRLLDGEAARQQWSGRMAVNFTTLK